jgi:DNA mismatch endonuclease (patch repair protein)
MADNRSKTQRSYVMSRIKGSKTKPELAVRAILRRMGFAYQPKGIYGRPDFANRKDMVAIFVDGCFWHGCPEHYKKPRNNQAYWMAKRTINFKRDAKVNKFLREWGWRVIRLWEHQIAAKEKA